MYDKIPRAEDAQSYLDAALTKGRIATTRTAKNKNKLTWLKEKERDRMGGIKESVVKSYSKLHDAYPSFDHMSEFTRKIFELDFEVGPTKQAIGALKHVVTTVRELTREYQKKLQKESGPEGFKRVSSEYIGRVSSVIKQSKKHLVVLNKARAVLRSMPFVNDELFTVAIAGFPNVGKSTLLGKLTGATPEIESYAFTTKGLNAGYFSYKYNKIQCIDTPGTLNRKEANDIEKKADITLKYLANLIVYVFDPTEASYPLKKQEELYESLKEFDIPMIVYVSKTDIATEEQIAAKEKGAFKNVESLKEAITKAFRKWV